MATYTNTIPANLLKGDILKFTVSGTWSLPTKNAFSLDMRGARGGPGGDAGSAGAPQVSGGPGGYGGKLEHPSLVLDGTIVISIGEVGTTGTYGSSNVEGTRVSGGTGRDGGLTSLSNNGSVTASVLGGKGGKGGAVTIYGKINPGNPNPVTGAAGANQGASVVPTGGVATVGGGNTGAGTVTLTVVNQPPTDPTGMFYAAPNAGKPVTITWTASTDPDGDPIQYVVERRIGNGVYQQIAITGDTFYTDICPTSGTYYQVRVKAVDDKGGESGYVTGTSLPINYNNPPEITGEDIDWGALTQPRTYDYTPSDPDEGNVLTVVEQVTNGTEVFTLRAFTAESGQKYTADFSSVWMQLAKGSHALVITVDDGQGGEATRTITFSRPVQRIAASRAFSTDKPVTQALISIYPGLPADASLHLEVCNNPFDETPTWEDVTAKVGKYVHAFESTEAVSGPGLAYRFTITPGAMPVHFDMAVIRFKHGGEEYVYQG